MTATASRNQPITLPCTRCSGRGHIRAFSNVAGGVCFECGGSGGRVTTQAKEDRRVKAAAKRAADRKATEAARVERYVDAYLVEAITAGQSAQDCHDARCMCGGFCWATYNGGGMARRWVELGGVL